MYVETGRFLRELAEDIQIAGGRIVVRRFASPPTSPALPEQLVFNCTGLGAGALFGDTTLYPIRGQLAILIPQPEVNYAFNGSAGYMFPRADGILLGGTYRTPCRRCDARSRTTSPASSNRTASCSPASAVEVGCAAADIGHHMHSPQRD